MPKSTWVFVAGTYRTGSTTHYQMARDIVEETGNGIGIGYHTEAKLREFDADSDHRYIVCKVFEYLPEGFRGETSHGEIIHRQKRLKAVVSIRDPRDIIVSMRKRDDQRGNGFDFKRVATEDFPVWLGQVERWADLGPYVALVSKFEHFTVNLLTEVRRIARHLDIELSDELAKDIAKRYTIRSQQERKEEHKKAGPDAREDPWLPSIPSIVFGTSGHWQTWLNGAERKMVYEANSRFFDRFGYER